MQGNLDIYINEIAGGRQSRFTFDPALEQGANWSPDASRIVFNTTRNGNWTCLKRWRAEPGTNGRC